MNDDLRFWNDENAYSNINRNKIAHFAFFYLRSLRLNEIFLRIPFQLF